MLKLRRSLTKLFLMTTLAIRPVAFNGLFLSTHLSYSVCLIINILLLFCHRQMKIKTKMKKVPWAGPVFGLVHIPSIIVRVLEIREKAVRLHQARTQALILQLHQSQQRNRKEKEIQIHWAVSLPLQAIDLQLIYRINWTKAGFCDFFNLYKTTNILKYSSVFCR